MSDNEPLSLGPRIGLFFQSCLEESGAPFTVSLVIGTASLLATLGLATRHVGMLHKAPICPLRTHYKTIMIFPTAWGISAYMTLICPRSSLLAELIRGQSEAFALYVFMRILYMLMSLASIGKHDQDHSIAKAILEAINSDGERSYFAVPPLGCCFKPCAPKHLMSAQLLLRIAWLVKQYVISEFFISIFSLWIMMAARAPTGHALKLASTVVLKVSGISAVYGLVVMYKGTKGLLKPWHTTQKFISIKFVLLLSLIQSHVLRAIIEHIQKEDRTCLRDPNDPGNLEFVINHWMATVLSVEAVLMAVLVMVAFPAREVVESGVEHPAIVEMRLAQLCLEEQQRLHQRHEDVETRPCERSALGKAADDVAGASVTDYDAQVLPGTPSHVKQIMTVKERSSSPPTVAVVRQR